MSYRLDTLFLLLLILSSDTTPGTVPFPSAIRFLVCIDFTDQVLGLVQRFRVVSLSLVPSSRRPKFHSVLLFRSRLDR